MAGASAQKRSLFDDSDGSDESDGGVNLKVNDAYAKRFEHNKKREELHRLEEKYKSQGKPVPANLSGKDDEDDDDDSSSDETEDEHGFLATEELDAQISATLQAIRSKDPRVYDGKTTFYSPVEEAAAQAAAAEKKEKPVYLQDYHRAKILRGDTGADADEADDEPPQTYAQEQDALKKSIQDEIKAQMSMGAEEDDDFVKAKEPAAGIEATSGMHPSRAAKVAKPKVDIAIADKDPELFLSNFMASRAWAEEDGHKWEAFESDDGEEDGKADEWEIAYNLRFEDPNKSNEVLRSYARDVAASRSVRREEKSGRKRLRELEQERKEAEKQERHEERARLRRLKIDEAEAKLAKIKKAAGLSGKSVADEEWVKLLDDAWDDSKWEEEMAKTFGDDYYAEGDDGEEGSSSKKAKKPKWDDDIDIKDLIPDFEEAEPQVTLSDAENGQGEADDDEAEEDDDEDGRAAKRQKTTKERKKERLASQKEARQERAKIEALVDAKMDIEDPELLIGSSKKGQGRFLYRETPSVSFGMTTRDILMAPNDAALNEFVGLKKLAHFRAADKQAKDKKRLGKKARLRQWRRETFGAEFEREGPKFDMGPRNEVEPEAEKSNIVGEVGASRKKRKRSKGKKSSS